jgi:hypothetical protein
MIALALWRESQCSGCGGDLAETTTHDRWIPVPPLMCWKCDAIAAQQDTYAKEHRHMAALRWGAERG